MTDPMKLHALADGELDPKEAIALREALKAEPRATAEVDAILNLKDVLANQSVRHMDADVWSGCVQRLNAIDKTRRVEGFVGRYAWAMCGVLFLFILSGRVAMRNVQGDTVRTADIIRFSGESGSPDAQKMAKIWADMLKGATTGLDRTKVEMHGMATAGLYNGMRAERVPLRDGDGDLVLLHVEGELNLPDTAPMATHPDLAATVADGANCVVWRTAGATWLLSGNRSFESLAEVATRIVLPR